MKRDANNMATAAQPEINWAKVHKATERFIREARRMRKQSPDDTGCTNEEMIEALNNTRAQLERGGPL